MTQPDWDSTTNITRYTQVAKELRELAAQSASPDVRAQLVILAIQYEHLAAHANRIARDTDPLEDPMSDAAF